MKLICLDLDNCSYTAKYSELADFLDLSLKFHRCPECNSLSILVEDDFYLDVDDNFIFQLLEKIKKKNDLLKKQ